MRNSLRRLLWLPMLAIVGVADAASQQAQTTVTGRVVNAETLAPLNGVLITVEGQSSGVLSGTDGRYSIQVPGDATLIFSMLGFTPHEEPVQNRSVIDVAL